jgi:hypothetical protein
MNKEIEKLVGEYNSKEEELTKALSDLHECGEECSCDTGIINTIKMIHYGEWMEIQTLCLDCGGYVEARE